MKRSFTSAFFTAVLSVLFLTGFQARVSAECNALFGYNQADNSLLITFHDSSTSSFTITTWHWDFGDGHSSNDHNITHTYANPGTYEVCLTIHDNHDCNDTYCHAVIVQQVGQGTCEAFFTYEQVAGTLGIHFIDGSESTHDIISWAWTFGDGGTSDNHAPTHIYDQPGTYEVCLTIHDNTGCSDSYCHAVIVGPNQNTCEAFFEYEQEPNTLSIHFFDGSESNHTITSWLWTFGDGESSEQHMPNHTYDETGTYEVCLTIHDNTGCTDTYCHIVIVSPVVPGNCEASFTYEQVPNTLSIHFHSTSTSSHQITSYWWNFGDNHNGDGQNPTHTYPEAGTYVVCLAIHDNSDCNDTVCVTIIVQPITPGNCDAFFLYEQEQNALTIHFNDESESNHDIISWLWTFGDGTSSDDHVPVHTYSTPGTYEVCLTIHDNTGCTDTYCHAVIVEPVVAGNCEAFFVWYQVQGTQTIHFIDSSFSEHNITSYSWDFGDNHTGDGQNPNHYYPVGTYEVCLTIHDNSGCTDTYCTVVTVLPETPGECNALFEYDQLDNSQTIHFINHSTSNHDITSYQWSFGDGHGGDGQNPNHTYENAGTYEVCLIIHDNSGCTDTFCTNVIVLQVEPGNCGAFFGWYQISGTQTIQFIDSSFSEHDITSYSWNFGDGHEGDGQDPHHYFPVGTYEVCLTIHDNTGCTDTYCTTITVLPETPGDCNALFTYFPGDNSLIIHFIDSSSSSHDITTWHWDFGDGHTSNDHNVTHHYDHSGSYEVCLTIHDNHDCEDTYCHVVIVESNGEGECHALFSFQHEEGSLTFHFTNASTSPDSIISYQWYFGDGGLSDNPNPNHTYDHPGTYNVCLVIHDNHGCVDEYCHQVTIGNGSSCQAVFSTSVDSLGLTVTFTNTSVNTPPNTIYHWTFGDGTESDDENPVHTYTHHDNYEVCLFIHHPETNCESHVCHVVHVFATGGLHLDGSSDAAHNMALTKAEKDFKSEHFISIYPNPASVTTNIEYELTEGSDVEIELCDLFGYRVRQVTKGNEDKGVHKHTVDSGNLNPGIYIFKLRINQEIIIRKVTITQ